MKSGVKGIQHFNSGCKTTGIYMKRYKDQNETCVKTVMNSTKGKNKLVRSSFHTVGLNTFSKLSQQPLLYLVSLSDSSSITSYIHISSTAFLFAL